MDYNLNIKLKMIKLLEENASFLTLVSAMIFFFAFSTKSRGNKIKNKEMGQITEYKASAQQRNLLAKMRGQPIEKVFANHVSYKRLISKIHKELI